MDLKEDSWISLKEDSWMSLDEFEGEFLGGDASRLANGHGLQCVAVRDSICHTHGTALQGRNTSADTNTTYKHKYSQWQVLQRVAYRDLIYHVCCVHLYASLLNVQIQTQRQIQMKQTSIDLSVLATSASAMCLSQRLNVSRLCSSPNNL